MRIRALILEINSTVNLPLSPTYKQWEKYGIWHRIFTVFFGGDTVFDRKSAI
jgi:hypothetical protein